MAQSQPNLGILQPFYGWYKQVVCYNFETEWKIKIAT
jgi:hypothetical protein